MLVPRINWIPFDKDDSPKDIAMGSEYLVLLKEDNYDNGATWTYSVDVATPYGCYISDFWDTESDWKEGQSVEVVAYAEMPYMIKEPGLEAKDVETVDLEHLASHIVEKYHKSVTEMVDDAIVRNFVLQAGKILNENGIHLYLTVQDTLEWEEIESDGSLKLSKHYSLNFSEVDTSEHDSEVRNNTIEEILKLKRHEFLTPDENGHLVNKEVIFVSDIENC